jgi:hypothetical protein
MRGSAVTFGACALFSAVLASGCSQRGSSGSPGASAETRPTTGAESTTASPSASVATDHAPPKDETIAVLTPEKFAPNGDQPREMFPIEGAIMVTEGLRRVGRINGDKIEWLEKSIPEGGAPFGEHVIDAVVGRWPDEVGVLFRNGNPRAPEPTYFPLTGKGMARVTGAGGVWATIRGVARIGDSTIVAVNDSLEGVVLNTVRGKTTRKLKSAPEAGCKEGEVEKNPNRQDDPGAGIRTRTMESTPAGSLVVVGMLCEKRGPAAEVWDPSGNEHIVDLSHDWLNLTYTVRLLKGAGDELFLVNDGFRSILRIHDGAFDRVPDLGSPILAAFTSPDGKLYAYDGRSVSRFDGNDSHGSKDGNAKDENWSPIARIAKPDALNAIYYDGDRFWGEGEGGVVVLRETSREPIAQEECKTPFVYLFDENDDDPPQYEYPHTREKLAAFPEAADLELVEFEQGHQKRIGIPVKSREQGEALVAYAKENMKDDEPFFVCYEPKALRKIPAKPAPKKK